MCFLQCIWGYCNCLLVFTTGHMGFKLVLCYLGLFWGDCLICLNFNFWGLVSLLLPFRIGFGIIGTYKWLVVQGFVTWGGILLVWNLGNFNSAVCDALVVCRYMYCGYSTGTVIPTYLLCGVLRLVGLLPRGVCAKNFECGAFIYGVVLVTVMTISWFGACVRLNFSPKRRVLWVLNFGYTCFVLVGHWLWIVIGV